MTTPIYELDPEAKRRLAELVAKDLIDEMQRHILGSLSPNMARLGITDASTVAIGAARRAISSVAWGGVVRRVVADALEEGIKWEAVALAGAAYDEEHVNA